MLRIVMYHYVRDLPNTRFPRIKGMLLEDFRAQVDALRSQYEMATLESALAYVDGEYAPSRDLCLLTFDDAVKEHYAECTPILADRGIQGVFHLITKCANEDWVASVHKNHFLMADLDFADYRQRFLALLPEGAGDPESVDAATAARTYPWDTAEVASFKYFFNFQMDAEARDAMIDRLFADHFGDERPFARDLYVSWDEARQMQDAGMILGGHTHEHKPLSRMPEAAMLADLRQCRQLLDAHLQPQAQTPFCYPYGKRDSYTPLTTAEVKRLGFACSFTTESPDVTPGADRFALTRKDCKVALPSPIPAGAR
jgi:peptidoglycan/xylan/chitin deacetylase (PgdA/CDA1 family)